MKGAKVSVRALWPSGSSQMWIDNSRNVLEKKVVPKVAGVTGIPTDNFSNVEPNVDHAAASIDIMSPRTEFKLSYECMVKLFTLCRPDVASIMAC
jgi:hypothetical protein